MEGKHCPAPLAEDHVQSLRVEWDTSIECPLSEIPENLRIYFGTLNKYLTTTGGATYEFLAALDAGPLSPADEDEIHQRRLNQQDSIADKYRLAVTQARNRWHYENCISIKSPLTQVHHGELESPLS